MSDIEVLRLAARDGRVLVTGDLNTMPGHFKEFTAGEDSPGLLLVPPRSAIGEIIDGLVACWLAWAAEEMRNQIRWLPRS
jgi:hypothetical protein